MRPLDDDRDPDAVLIGAVHRVAQRDIQRVARRETCNVCAPDLLLVVRFRCPSDRALQRLGLAGGTRPHMLGCDLTGWLAVGRRR